MSSKQGCIAPSNSKAKIAERIAFDPFLPQQDIINEFIRNTINPDIDSGKTYYLGQVINIIEPDDPSIDQRDIFYSYSDNSERVSKAIDGKKFNKKRKILLVHIPSFLTNSKKSTSKLNYDSFTKIRVEYFDNVSIGNIVKLQFYDKNSFYNPHILSVDTDTTPDFIQQESDKAIKAFNDYKSCKVLNLSFPTDISKASVKKSTRPAGGYTQGLAEIANIFSKTYVSAFSKGLSPKTHGDITKIKIEIKKVLGNSEVVSGFEFPNGSTIDFVGNEPIPKDYLLAANGQDVIISAEDSEFNDKLREEFYNYVKLDLEARTGFTFSFDNKDNKFALDVNSNFIINKSEKILQDYIDISNLLIDSYSVLRNIPPAKSSSSTASSQTAKPKDFSDKCDADLAKDKTTYDLVHDGKKIDIKFAPKSDISIITSFLKKQDFQTEKYIETNYFIELAGGIPKEDKKFYTSTTNDKYGKGVINSFNIKELKENLDKVQNYLKRLKRQIERWEGYSEKSNDVLVLPIQVFKKRTYPLPIGKVDKNSRHYYGKAFDIRVYLKTDNKVVQIPPEIVALYCNLDNIKLDQIIGQGIFREYRYNHIEFTTNLTPEEQKERQLFTSGKKDPVEKSLEQLPPGPSRITKLKEIIRQGANYINPVTKQLDPRFDLLTQ